LHEVSILESDHHPHTVALFSSQKKAEEYELKSRSETYMENCGDAAKCEQYKKESLLCGYCYAKIELYKEDYILDPEIEIVCLETRPTEK